MSNQRGFNVVCPLEYKTKFLLEFHITKDTHFTNNVSVLQVLPECKVSRFRALYTNNDFKKCLLKPVFKCLTEEVNMLVN